MEHNLWFDSRFSLDARICEYVVIVSASAREFRYDSSLDASLEPVQSPRRQRVLLPRPQQDLMIDRVVFLLPGRRDTVRPWGLFSGNVQIDDAPATSEGFLLSRFFIHVGMIVLRASLTWEDHDLLRAIPLGIDVDDYL